MGGRLHRRLCLIIILVRECLNSSYVISFDWLEGIGLSLVLGRGWQDFDIQAVRVNCLQFHHRLLIRLGV